MLTFGDWELFVYLTNRIMLGIFIQKSYPHLYSCRLDNNMATLSPACNCQRDWQTKVSLSQGCRWFIWERCVDYSQSLAANRPSCPLTSEHATWYSLYLTKSCLQFWYPYVHTGGPYSERHWWNHQECIMTEEECAVSVCM